MEQTDLQLLVRSEGSPREARLKVLKRELVAQMLGKPGDYREAIKEVRSYWRIEAPPLDQLPQLSEEILLPPALSAPRNPSNLHAAWAHHPDLPPGLPSDELTVARNLERRWQDDLLHALRRGGVPAKYIAGSPPRTEHPSTSTRLLAWSQFAAACVLCDVPVLQAPVLAEVGGASTLREEVEGEGILGVVSPDQQMARAVAAAEWEAYDKMVADKVWELGRGELGDDLAQAKLEVELRFAEELQAECARARGGAERLLELNPRRKYLIEFDPEEDWPADVNKTVDAVVEECGVTPRKHGNLPQGDLQYVMIARLLEDPDWSEESVAKVFGLSLSSVKSYEKKGKKIVAGSA